MTISPDTSYHSFVIKVTDYGLNSFLECFRKKGISITKVYLKDGSIKVYLAESDTSCPVILFKRNGDYFIANQLFIFKTKEAVECMREVITVFKLTGQVEEHHENELMSTHFVKGNINSIVKKSGKKTHTIYDFNLTASLKHTKEEHYADIEYDLNDLLDQRLKVQNEEELYRIDAQLKICSKRLLNYNNKTAMFL